MTVYSLLRPFIIKVDLPVFIAFAKDQIKTQNTTMPVIAPIVLSVMSFKILASPRSYSMRDRFA